MPRLACFRCGRLLDTVAPIEALFAEERRCPRCGAFLGPERREAERRAVIRRVDPSGDGAPPRGGDRRGGERRRTERRRPAAG